MSEASRWSWFGDAVLFDLDGTLVNSEASVVRAWHWASAELDVPFSTFVPFMHGIPAGEAITRAVPRLSAAEVIELAEQLNTRQAEDSSDVVATPGALKALDELPSTRWAIVTSGDRRLATARIRAAGLPAPRVLVTADDVQTGKPDPEPYLHGARLLGVQPGRCLVVEDAPAGVESARNAGMVVLGVLTSSANLAGAAAEVADLTHCTWQADRIGLRLEVERDTH
jgi:mannitol-1-/sugar-/sorbitol-6-phosphatase